MGKISISRKVAHWCVLIAPTMPGCILLSVKIMLAIFVLLIKSKYVFDASLLDQKNNTKNNSTKVDSIQIFEDTHCTTNPA